MNNNYFIKGLLAVALSGATTLGAVAQTTMSDADEEEIGNLMMKFNFLHSTTVLPTATASNNAVTWAFTPADGASDYVSFADGTLTVNSLPQGSSTVTVGVITATVGGASVSHEVKLAPDDNRGGYLYCFMNSSDETTNYALGTLADKGRKFSELLDGGEIFDTYEIAQIEHGTRDAYLGRGEDNDGFFITTTDMKQAVSGVWHNKGLNLVRSKDLIHWEGTTFNFLNGKSIFSDPDATTDGYKTDAEYAKITRVWAPQFIWDKDANNGEGAYLVYYSLLSTNSGDTYDRIFYSYTDREFKTLTQPRIFFDPGIAVIDADIVFNPYDSLYHMYYKREGADGYERGIYEATSPKLVGATWKDVMHVTNEGSQQVEGSSTVRRINEDMYNLYYMRYSGGSAYKYCETDHLGLNASTSAALQGTGSFQHGSVITITADEYAMLEAWDNITKTLPDIKALWKSTGAEVFGNAVKQTEEALALTTVDELAVALPAASQALADAVVTYKQELSEKFVEGSQVDITPLLANADFSNGKTGWSGSSFTQVTNGVAEFYNKTFNTYQLLTDMPAGYYRLQAQGFYRNGNKSTGYSAHKNNREQLLAKLYINTASTPFMSLFDESAPYTVSPYNYPDDIAGANTAFNTDSAYTDNMVTYQLTAEGDLKIGVQKTTSKSDDWTCFDNLKLYYLGSTDGISDVRPSQEASVDVYTIGGVKLRSSVSRSEAVKGLDKGLYIVGKNKVVVQ